MRSTSRFLRILATACVLGTTSSALAEDGVWRVSKSSGEVWLTTSGAQPASLGQEEALKPGDTIRTGRSGRVLLTRGEETILVTPNTVIALPAEKKDGLSTTIVQRAGSILLEVEKRNVKHFEVETPYLAAVVKGTQFSVSVNAASATVNVLRGQVEVADFKSGQIAQVMPGQVATAFAHGKSGLSLSGSGTLNPIEQGKPRASSIERIMVPKSGLSAPRSAANGQLVLALGNFAASGSGAATKPGATRISASLGEVRLNFRKVTHGLAHGTESAPGSAKRTADKDTIWSSREAKASLSVGSSNSTDAIGVSNNGAATGMNTTNAPGTAAPAAAAAANNAGNGAANGNGNGNGNGNAYGLGNGNGNGKALGHFKP